MLRYKGAAHFRQRIILATLSGRAVRIDDIRSEEEQVGLRDYEACFLRLLEKVVNGCEIVINETGTAMRYRPGIIVGGGGHVHECGTSRAISYFIQPLLALAPFGKLPLGITLRGVTNATGDMGVDVLRTVTLPMLRHFGLSDGLSLQVNKRGAPPLGGGEVYMQMAIVRELTPCDLTETGKVKRVRGVAYGTKVSPQICNRLVDASRGVLNHFLPDVWVYTDVFKGKTSGLSAGFALTLVAETTSGALLSAEAVGAGGVMPEEVGTQAAEALLQQVREAGTCDSANQPLALVLMALGPEDVSRLRLGTLTEHSIGLLRLLRDFFGVTFRIDSEPDGSVVLTCRGVGFKNLSKRTT
jgi:RNA 3'-terminal phosphate cyclase-like protein